MPSLLTKLENNEAVLLMYLANELPAEDRAEVDLLLERDETLRSQLQDVRAAYASLDRALGTADHSSNLPSGFAASRSVGDAVRRAAEARVSIDEKDDTHSRHRHWLMYPLGAAAVILLGMFLWWQNVSDELNRPADISVTMNRMPGRTMLEWDMSVGPTPVESRLAAVTEIEQELQSVNFLSESLR